ncbi:MAG: LysM peptidoglycan-binding domain-containing protein, partial [Chitinophagales bacterium]
MQQFLIISCLFFFFLAPLKAQESENKIVIENNEYTLHKVKPGETLFSISKKYGLSVEELKKANRLSESSSIDFDRILIIPLFAALEKEEQQEMQETSTAFFTHKVEQGETLYSIARAYENVSPAQIKLM